MYEFRNLKYKTTRRGVHVKGDVFQNGRKVGTFEQKPYAACIARIPGKMDCETAEKLLSAAEDKILNAKS